ncbi:hypothetical protein FQK07_08395 [Synechococcus sp. BSF8S]|uniref:hypothetical protein n=1 Tax=Synechococcales TaxID=1890424 RepID=UPI00162784B5|nr:MULTISPECIES: hypothetical protein [unclassified Synechococcus]MBC1261293.1 hypothetical protein [Synechococcus sp. BSF8S]MBC1264196.1 hypothetical protein [Synechococcus sp. BSA11S]
MTGHDRQWELNRLNFEGRWCGTRRWYERSSTGVLDLTCPSAEIEGTSYAISLSDPDTGLWDGSGLRFAPDGRRQLPLSRSTYNGGGQCWQFRGAAGQSSLAVDGQQPRFGHEVNLFRGRSRSMLVLLYAPLAAAPGDPPGWRLQSLGVVPFRCGLAPEPDPPRPAASDWRALLAEQEGWPGELERLEPHRWPAADGEPQPCEPFHGSQFSSNDLTAGFADGLLCSLPEQLPEGAFALQVGCRLDADHFQQVSLTYDTKQRLTAWELRRFRRP